MFLYYVPLLCSCTIFLYYVPVLCSCTMSLYYVPVLYSCTMFLHYVLTLCSCTLFLYYVPALCSCTTCMFLHYVLTLCSSTMLLHYGLALLILYYVLAPLVPWICLLFNSLCYFSCSVTVCISIYKCSQQTYHMIQHAVTTVVYPNYSRL